MLLGYVLMCQFASCISVSNFYKEVEFVKVIDRVSDVMLTYFDLIILNVNEIEHRNVASLLKCSAVCANEMKFDCNSFEFQLATKLCVISSKPLNKWSDSIKYRIKMECPPNSFYAPDVKSCYMMITGNLTGDEAHNLCNNMNMHPIVVDDANETKYISKHITIPQVCLDPSKRYYHLRTAGKFNPLLQVFQWLPYSTSIPFNYTNWSYKQPDTPSVENGCLQFFMDFSWDDYLCSAPYCVLCEFTLH